ncbi:MAG: YfaP family protein, partial [Lysobacter sp.]
MLRRAAAPACLVLAASFACAAADDAGGVRVISATIADQPIDGAALELTREGQPTLAAISDAQGRAALDSAALRDRAARLSVRKAGYAELLAQCPCDGADYALSPAMRSLDGLRVVLGWNDASLDLDSHLSFPGNHIYYERKNGDDARLDLDDTEHRGPETITVQRKHPGEVYTYAVHDFGHRQHPDADALARSRAQVYVYVGQTLVRTYTAPRQPGNLWSVFRIDGDGRFEDINRTGASRASAERIGVEIAQTDGAAADSDDDEHQDDANQANQRG